MQAQIHCHEALSERETTQAAVHVVLAASKQARGGAARGRAVRPTALRPAAAACMSLCCAARLSSALIACSSSSCTSTDNQRSERSRACMLASPQHARTHAPTSDMHAAVSRHGLHAASFTQLHAFVHTHSCVLCLGAVSLAHASGACSLRCAGCEKCFRWRGSGRHGPCIVAERAASTSCSSAACIDGVLASSSRANACACMRTSCVRAQA